MTPHWAGAVDIVAVRQPDGALKASPFYVRFGKYQTFRRNRRVTVRVNDVLMDFGLELGQYGSALFSHEADAEGAATGALQEPFSVACCARPGGRTAFCSGEQGCASGARWWSCLARSPRMHACVPPARAV